MAGTRQQQQHQETSSSSSVNRTMMIPNSSTRSLLQDEIFALMDDDASSSSKEEKQREVLDLLNTILKQGRQFREQEQHGDKDSIEEKKHRELLKEQRRRCYQDFKDGKLDTAQLVLQLRHISSLLWRNNDSNDHNGPLNTTTTGTAPVTKKMDETSTSSCSPPAAATSESLRTELEDNLKHLAHVVAGSNSGDKNDDDLKKLLPWRLRYVTDIDPESQNPTISFQGGAILDSHGRNVWADYCGTCVWEILYNDDDNDKNEGKGEGDEGTPRWRCMSCTHDGVQCQECHVHIPLHTDCDPGPPVVEYAHPTFPRLDIVSPPRTLSETLQKLFQTWSHRPCFRPHNNEGPRWLTYRQVYVLATKLGQLFQSHLMPVCDSSLYLCYPGGSMDFYLCDLACAMCDITTIGLPTAMAKNNPSFSPDESGGTTAAATHFIVCDEQLQPSLAKVLPPDVEFIDIRPVVDANMDNSNLDKTDEPLLPIPEDRPHSSVDPEDALYTIYYTSGSTGVPKEIPITRREFLKDFLLSGEIVPGCCLSFLPPCWATDRMLVYQALYNGWRVGFARRDPSLPEILADLQELEPTIIVAPPLFLQFLSTMDPPPSLGSRLRHLGTGGASVGATTKRFVQQAYGVEWVESYGTTECGGIASGGRVLPDMQTKLRIRDTDTGEFLSSSESQSELTGELWVDDFNTQDIVQLTEGGTKINVLGRSGFAASFKQENGEWCSLLDIEEEIVRCCCPELLEQAMVFRNSKGTLVLVAFTKITGSYIQDASDASLLLSEVRRRLPLPPESQPRALVVTQDRFPMTETLKVKRKDVAEVLRDKLEQAEPIPDNLATGLDVVTLASQLLGTPAADPNKSFLENGGDSISAVQWLTKANLYFGGEKPLDWRSLLNNPLSSCLQSELTQAVDQDVASFEPPSPVSASANHILLTGATGFLGRHVLQELLLREPNATIVCLVRAASPVEIEETERVRVVTKVPMGLEYRLVIHLAAEVDHIRDYDSLKASNVDLTERLLSLRLAPMLFSSTLSTKDRKGPPFSDGYTHTKWVSEQMVLRSGGTCVWPPFLLWGNRRDWLTRLLVYCVQQGVYPSQLGFLASAPVQICAQEVVAGRQCSAWDLDLKALFTLLRTTEYPHLKPISLSCFRTILSMDPDSEAYPILPLLQGDLVGSPRSSDLALLPLHISYVLPLIRALLP